MVKGHLRFEADYMAIYVGGSEWDSPLGGVSAVCFL